MQSQNWEHELMEELFLLPFPSPLLFSPLEVGPQLNQLGVWGSAANSPSGARKRIWCTLELPESHWWQSFWVFWSACFITWGKKTRLHHSWGVFWHPIIHPRVRPLLHIGPNLQERIFHTRVPRQLWGGRSLFFAVKVNNIELNSRDDQGP